MTKGSLLLQKRDIQRQWQRLQATHNAPWCRKRQRPLQAAHRKPVESIGHEAASLLLSLADLGCREAVLLVRDPARAAETLAAVARHPAPPSVEVATLGSDVPRADVLVSTVPATAQHDLTGLVAGVGVVFDVVYDPWPTPLASAATARGLPVATGLDMLLHQAFGQVEQFTGRPAPRTVMRSALEEAARFTLLPV